MTAPLGKDLAVLIAEFGDLVHAARAELGDADFETFLVLAVNTLSKQVADRFEIRWIDE